MRKPEFRSSEPMKSWSLQSIHNPSCSSTEEHTGTPGLTGQTLTINKTTCGTWFIKKKHKKKKKNKGTDPPAFTQPAPWTSSGLWDIRLPCKVGDPCSTTDAEKEWCIRESPWDPKQLQPRLPHEDPNNPTGWAGSCKDRGKLKLKQLFHGFKTKGGPVSLEHRLCLPNGFQLCRSIKTALVLF